MAADYTRTYKRFGKYAIEEVLEKVPYDCDGKPINDMPDDLVFNDLKVHMTSMRYRTFKKSGVKCVTCGIEGQYFMLEQPYLQENKSRAHFNLYAIDEDGNEVQMTKDHIHPVSRSGRNMITNFQTMCAACNLNKGNVMPNRIGKKKNKKRNNE